MGKDLEVGQFLKPFVVAWILVSGQTQVLPENLEHDCARAERSSHLAKGNRPHYQYQRLKPTLRRLLEVISNPPYNRDWLPLEVR